MSPFPFAEPVRAIILFGDFHSADNKQSHPQIDRPEIGEKNDFIFRILWVDVLMTNYQSNPMPEFLEIHRE